MNRNRLAVAALAAALPLALSLPARAQQQPVQLGYGISADAHVFIHGRASATPDLASVRLERAIAGLVDSRIHEDILDLATTAMSRRQAEEVRAGFHHVLGILGRTDWATLFRKEVVFAERIALPMPDYVLICRVPADGAEAQLAGIRSMFEGFAEMAQRIGASVRDVDHPAGRLVELSFGDLPFQFAAGQVHDAIVLSASTQTTIASMRGLASDGNRSIVKSERFVASSAQIPAGSESTAFVDIAGLMGFMNQMLGMAEAGAGGDREAVMILGIIRSVLDELDIVDNIATSSHSDGTSVRTTAFVRMREDYRSSRLVDLCANQKPWTDWNRFVPADATSFAFDSGIDIGGLFDFVESIAAEAMGEGGRAPWSEHPIYKEVRQKAGYVSGEIGCVTFPAKNQMGSDSVLLMRLEGTEGVADWFGAHLRWIARFLESKGQTMTVTTKDGLHEVELAAFPWIRPVIGVRGDLLVFATSPQAIARVEAVHHGQEPDIRSSKRFASLGLGGEGVGDYIDYGQMENGAGDFANLLSAAGFCLSLLPEDRDSRPAIKLGAILTKLAPALRELDLAFDYGTEMVPAQQPGAFLTRTVYRYRDAR